jgi:hypothetical protein
MGTVSPSYIKNLVYKLLEKHAGEWTADFEENKKKVELYTDIQPFRVLPENDQINAFSVIQRISGEGLARA